MFYGEISTVLYKLHQEWRQDEKSIVETMQKKVNEELAAHEIVRKEMISANIKNTNDRLDNILKEIADLKESLEFTEDQMKDEISEIKKELKKPDKNIKKFRTIS